MSRRWRAGEIYITATPSTRSARETRHLRAESRHRDAPHRYGEDGSTVVAKGDAGCSDLDDVTANIFWCKPTNGVASCRADCESATPAEIAAEGQALMRDGACARRAARFPPSFA